MKKQKKYTSVFMHKLLFVLLMVFGNCVLLLAQTDYWDAISNIKSAEMVEDAKNGKRSLPIFNNKQSYIINFTGSYVDLTVPNDVKYPYFRVELKGGDGGSRKYPNLVTKAYFYTHGGGSATMKAYYEIGNAKNQIGAGDTIRLVIGNRGEMLETSQTLGANGGSGSGMFLKKKNSSAWITLMVAGAGGGAMSGGIDDNSAGKSANIRSYGSSGKGNNKGDGGKDGHDGEDTFSNGGGGLLGAIKNGVPLGSKEKYFNLSHSKSYHQFGMGQGGTSNETNGGGGGGGYSGGGGAADGGGGGGGSYYNAHMDFKWMEGVINNKSASPEHGNAIFQFMDALPALPPEQTIRLASAPHKCLEVESQELHNGNEIQLWDCRPYVTTESWVVNDSEINLVYDDDMCVNVDGANTANGTDIRIKWCNNTKAQKWIYDGLTKQFRSALNLNKCLNDAYGGRTDNGTNIQLWDCHPGGGSGDRWLFVGAKAVDDPENAKYIVPVKATNLSVRSASYKELESNIQLWDKADGNYADQWYFDGMQIKLRTQQNLCIDLKSSNTSNGNNIQLWKCNDTDAQNWIYDGVTRTIRSAINPDKCMEVATTGGVFEKGKNIQIMDCNGLMRQKFLII